MGNLVKNRIRDDRVKSIYNHLVDWEELGVEIFKVSDTQYRLIKGLFRVDYYPKSSKYHINHLNKWGMCPAYKLIDLFKDEI
jgi:hypothetical protein